MNVNDRIALEIGRAVLARIIAEAQAEELRAQIEKISAADPAVDAPASPQP